MPSSAAFHEVARSGAGFRSLPGFARPPNRTRLTNSDSTNAFGCHGLSVGSAPIGTVTVPPGVPAAAGALVAAAGALVCVGAAAGAVVGLAAGAAVAPDVAAGAAA